MATRVVAPQAQILAWRTRTADCGGIKARGAGQRIAEASASSDPQAAPKRSGVASACNAVQSTSESPLSSRLC